MIAVYKGFLTSAHRLVEKIYTYAKKKFLVVCLARVKYEHT